jgi:hypothetical protein
MPQKQILTLTENSKEKRKEKALSKIKCHSIRQTLFLEKNNHKR